jgi:Arc/MetJ-type ribon-helix-helix transcriptional regulator
MTKQYDSISIPKILTDKILELLNKGETSFRNKTEFIVDAVRKSLREYGIIV